jgi:integrase/recombinase XerD
MRGIIKEAKKPGKRPVSWPAAIDLFETHLRARHVSPRTLEGALADVKHFESYLGEPHSPPRPDEITPHDLRGYQADLFSGAATGRPLSAGTVARITSNLAGFFKLLEAEGHVAAGPTSGLERPKLSKRGPGVTLTIKEVEALLGACDELTPEGLRDRALLEVLYATGLRRAEVIALDVSDLDRAEHEIRVRHGKGDKARVVPLIRSAWEPLDSYLERARPVLASKHPDSFTAVFLTSRGRRLNVMSFPRLFRSLAAKAGIKKRVTPHVWRRTFATHLLKGKVSLRHIQALLGHERLDTTAAYLGLDRDELRREILLHHPRERLNP